MKEKGFTLIELLAVIVVISLIILIVAPKVLNVINDSEDETNEISMKKYGEAVEIAISTYELQEKPLPNQFTTNFQDIEKYIKYDGARVECAVEKIYEDGSFYLEDCSVNGSEKKYSYKINKIYKNGEIVYFDVFNGKGCTNYHQDNSRTGYNGGLSKSESGTWFPKFSENQNSCLKFYAFNDDGSNAINLLLDHNITQRVAWNSTEINSGVPNEVLNSLYDDTIQWIGTRTPSNYEYKGTSKSYTINYSNYKARLITANEIAEITGNINWNETSSSSQSYYFDSLTTEPSITCDYGNTSGCKFGWLYDITSNNCTSYGCLNNSDVTVYGYWTSSARAASSNTAWAVEDSGNLTGVINVDYSLGPGVRPVIEVLKSKLN